MIHLSKIVVTLFFILFFEISVIAQQKFIISGIIPEMYNDVDIRLSSDNPAFQPVNTKAKNGRFQMSGEINQLYEHVYLSVSRNAKNLGGSAFFIKSGKMRVQILSLKEKEGPFEISYVDVPFLKEQERYNGLLKPIQDSLIALSKLLFTVEKGIRKGFNKDSLAEVVKALRNEQLNRRIQFIKAFHEAYIALYIFNTEIVNNLNLTPDSLMSLYTGFDPSLKETDLGRSVHTHIKKKQSLLVNNILPDFSFLTLKRQYYKLSSFRNREYILLCFWASWCRPCIKSLPILKKLDSTYKTKGLQLISVSIDDVEKNWLESLEKHDLPWLQTCDLTAWIEGSRVRSLYDINYIPQYFLIDKEGKLIYHSKQLNEGDSYTLLQKMLENLLH